MGFPAAALSVAVNTRAGMTALQYLNVDWP